jgi:hypothetical protein
MIDYCSKKWDSLSSLKKRIESDYESNKTTEDVICFNGFELTVFKNPKTSSNVFIYTLSDGQLSKEESS